MDKDDEFVDPTKLPFQNRRDFFENKSNSTENIARRRNSIMTTSTPQKQRDRLSVIGPTSVNKVFFGINERRKDTPRPPNSRPMHHKSFMESPIAYRSDYSSLAAIPLRKGGSDFIDTSDSFDFPKRNWSCRKESRPASHHFTSHSDINTSDASSSRFRVESSANNGSTISLFDEDLNNSTIADYTIDWKAIFKKISPRIINDNEMELTRYFLDTRLDLQYFQTCSLYRYISFDKVLDILFNQILDGGSNVDIEEELTRTCIKRDNNDLDISYKYIMTIVDVNIDILNCRIEEYEERLDSHSEKTQKLKVTLGKYSKERDLTAKINAQVDKICAKFELISKVIVSMVTYMAMWKVFNDFPFLNRIKSDNLQDCEVLLYNFRNSQKILEEQIIKFLKLFSNEDCDEVIKSVDQIFSEQLELSICLPIMKLKVGIDKDAKAVLAENPRVILREQFV